MERDVQDYHSMYINLQNAFRFKRTDNIENVNDNIVFEMELIKQFEINFDYILVLIKKSHESHLQDKEIVISIHKAVDSSVKLRNKKSLIERFIDSLNPFSNVDEDWYSFAYATKVKELDRIIEEENLNKEETYSFINNAFRDGYMQTTSTVIIKILPPVSRVAPTSDLTKNMNQILKNSVHF